MRFQAFVPLALLVLSPPSPLLGGHTDVVTVAISPSTEPGGGSNSPSISTDGRYLVFQSPAPNLVAGDMNEVSDIFVYDAFAGSTTLVSVDSAGVAGNDSSFAPAVSGDGNHVAFLSDASNLVPGDLNSMQDVFFHDRLTGVTSRVSIDSATLEGDGDSFDPAVSEDGRHVAFTSQASNLVVGDTNGVSDVFVHDRQTGVTSRVSVDSAGLEGNDPSFTPALSSDGRYVAFTSAATNLVANDTFMDTDIFVHDRQTGTTSRVSVSGTGLEGNDDSGLPSISADGRYVAFTSYASNLVAGDTNAVTDIFVHDRQTGATSRVSVASAGDEGNAWCPTRSSISPDGRYVAFSSLSSNLVDNDWNGAVDVFVHDLQTGATSRVPIDRADVEGGADSDTPAISSGGRYVGFLSDASNFVAGDTNGLTDLFLHDRQTGLTVRAPDAGLPPPAGALLLADAPGTLTPQAVSYEGRWVAFASRASNLVPGDSNGLSDIFVRDRLSQETSRISIDSAGVQAGGTSGSASISADGRYVAFHSDAANLVAGDTNAASDVFVRDRQTGVTSRISIDSAGMEGNGSSLTPSISADGRYVAFISNASTLVAGDTNGASDVFVHDRLTAATSRVSVDSAGVEGDSWSFYLPSISADGRYVAFVSQATNLVAGDSNTVTDVFVHDRLTASTGRVSVDSAGLEGDSPSDGPSISADGRYVAFQSDASNLVAGDTSNLTDIFVHDRQSGATSRVSVDSAGGPGQAASWSPSISADGRYVAFHSQAASLVPLDTNGVSDIFVHDRQTSTTRRESIANSGAQGDGRSDTAAISGNGQFVAFASMAANFIPEGDWNGLSDIFVGAVSQIFADGFESGATAMWSFATL